MRSTALFVVLAACGGDDTTTFAPVIDVPAVTSAAYPWTDLDSVTLLVTNGGTLLAQASFARDEAPSATVAFGSDIAVHLTGTRGPIEVAYGRTCAVTVSPNATPPAPHLYFAKEVRWAAGPMPAAMLRTGGDAYTAPNGSAVFVGGDGGETRLERFETDLGAFSTLGASVAPRDGAVLAPLADGSALRIGGTAGGNTVGFFELLLSPATLSEPVQHVDEPRLRLVGHAAATLVDGTVVVAGGDAQPGGAGPFTVSGATWIFALGDAGGPAPPRLLPAALAAPRSHHTMTRLGDDVGAAVLVVGGHDAANAPVATAEIYEPLREAYDSFHPAMVRPRFDHRAVRLPDGSVLVIGGRDAGGPVDSIEIYRPLLGQFATAGSLPANAGLTDMSVTPLADGRVLLAGGNDATGHAVTTTLIAQVDPVNGMVILSPTDAMAAPRARQEATLLCDGTVLLVGGTTDTAAPASERYNPPAAGRR